MSEKNVTINVDTLNNLKSKTKINLSDVSNNDTLKNVFKKCDIDKPVDVLQTNKELQAWKSSIETLINTSSSEEPNYVVKKGDTIPKIVKEQGYTGIDAKKYEQALKVQLQQNNSFMNDKGWLAAGSTIKLLSPAKIKELGLKKSSTNSSNSSSASTSYVYLVQSGDSLPKIIKALGYSGEDAKKYEEALDEQLEADGSYMNDKKWLRAGSKIRLLSQEKIKALGLSTSQSNSSKSSSKTTPSTPVKKDTVQSKKGTNPSDTTGIVDNSGLDKNIKKPKSTQTTQTITKNSIELIENTIKSANQKSQRTNINALNDKQKSTYNKYKSAYGVEGTFIKNISTNEVHVFFDVTDTKNGKGLGQQSIELIFTNDQNSTVTTNRYYTNGKIVQDTDWVESGNNKHTAKLLNKGNTKPKTKKVIDDPVKINSISIDPSVVQGASSEQKEAIKEFMTTLISKKADLMRELNIDDDEYNNFVKMAVGIAIQESGLEKGLSSVREFKNNAVGQFALDTLRVVGIGLNKLGTNVSTSTSKGLTQIKIGDWNDDPKIDKLLKKFGITATGYYDNLNSSESAIATIIVLNELSKKVKSNSAIQDGLEAAKDRFYITEYKRENGEVKQNSNGYMRVNQNVTENDAILYLYNGRAGAIKKGDMTPKDNVYTHNVRRYMNAITVTEDSTQRAAANKKARTVTENQNNKRSKMNDDLGWGIGQVTFGTNLYTGGTSKNETTEIENLEISLTQRGFNTNNIKSLISLMKKGDIAFANKLTDSEISSMTEADLELILKYSNKLNSQLSNVSNAVKKRKIATAIDKEFKKEYLESHAQQTYMSEVKGKTVKLTTSNKNIITGSYNTGAKERCNKYLTQLRGSHTADSGLWLYDDRVEKGKYTGFCVEKDKGINTTNASSVDILLAKNGADTANTLRTSGACLTGAKQTLIGSGAVSAEEMSTFSNAYQLANFLSKYPERFIEITHIQISDTVAREITAGDLSSLPAGCIVVFGNKNRTDVPGHAAITSGNGQMYADEVDNSNWDNFVASKANQDGKGEHGYFRVFKLNPNYYTMNSNGTKLIKK